MRSKTIRAKGIQRTRRYLIGFGGMGRRFEIKTMTVDSRGTHRESQAHKKGRHSPTAKICKRRREIQLWVRSYSGEGGVGKPIG